MINPTLGGTRFLFALWMCASAGMPPPAVHHLSKRAEQGAVSSSGRYKSNDTQLRQRAITSPAPAYPGASLAKKVAGVVVAAILIDLKGATEAVQILQSPDAETGRAVEDALKKWAFKPMGIGGKGILVFYFYRKGSSGVVLSPAEMREVTNPGITAVKRADEATAKLITEQELRALSKRSTPLLLDIRDRETFHEGHDQGAVNIPLDEVLTRAPSELSVSRHVVVDCREPPDFCAVVVHQLASSGFRQISLLRR